MQKNFGAENSANILSYVEKTFQPEDPVLREIRARSEKEKLPQIHVGPMDALHLEVITRAIGAKKAVEIGALAGLSGVAIARGLGESGRLYTFEADSRHADVAQESFEKAGVAGRVRIFRGPALQMLPEITREGPFDLVFIDANKEGYPAYLEWAAENLRVGGVVLGDNTLGFGQIGDDPLDPSDEEPIVALREFNRKLASGGRFRATLLPTGEGLAFGVKLR